MIMAKCMAGLWSAPMETV